MSDSTAGNRSPARRATELPPNCLSPSGTVNTQSILADQRQSWLRGQRPRVEDYLQWLPALAKNAEAVVELVIGEFRLCEELGQSPDCGEFERRFPEYAERIHQQFAHEGLGESDTDELPVAPTLVGSEGAVDNRPDDRPSTQIGDEARLNRLEDDPAQHNHLRDTPTSIIEASDALVRELQARAESGRHRPPDRTSIIEVLREALKHSSHSRASRPPTPLRAVPGYEIQAELGRGAVGVVYKARQTGLNRIVALKMILAGGHASRTTLARFRAEAEAVASLQHGNIVQIYEIGECEGLPYFSLEYCAGGSLADRLNGVPVPADLAARTLVKLARAMHYAHGCKVVHRDLKPGNVLLHPKDDAGRPVHARKTPAEFDLESVIVKVSDFGLAKRLDESSQTKTGAILGTPSYMAPEQASGKIRDVGPAADIYALGAILYELLTGRPPFRAATPLDTVVQVINDEPVPPRRLQSGLPADLETIALKCLEKEPLKRYGSAAALADDLERFVDGKPIEARPVGSIERAWRWCRRNPIVALLSTLAACSLVVGTAVSLFFAHQSRERADLAVKNEGRAKAERESALRSRYVAEMNLIQRAWRDGEMARVRALLHAQIPPTSDETDFRGPEWQYWDRLANAELATIKSGVGKAPCLAYRRDGRQIAAGGDGKSIAIWDVATGKEAVRLVGHTDAIVGLTYIPDGRLVSAATAHEIADGRSFVKGVDLRFWSTADKKLLGSVVVPSDAEVERFAVSSDGLRCAVACRDGAVFIVHATDGRLERRIEGNGSPALGVAFSADGTRIAAGFENGDVIIWNAASGAVHRRMERPRSVAHCVEFSPEGRRLAVGGGSIDRNDLGFRRDGDVRIWDLDSGRLIAEMAGHGGPVLHVEFSPNGRRVVSASTDRTVRIWDSLSAKPLAVFQGHERSASAATFSPNGRCVVSASDDGDIRFWDATSANEHALSIDQNRLVCAALSPNGRQIAVGYRGVDARPAEVALYDLVTGQGVSTMPLGGKSIFAIAWSAGGEKLAAAVSGELVHLIVLHPDDGRRMLDTALQLETAAEIAFSANGERIAVAGHQRIIVADAMTGARLDEFASPAGRIAALAFTTGSGLRAVSLDGQNALVWDCPADRPPRRLTGHSESIVSAAISSDQRLIATGSEDRTVRIWDAVSGNDWLGRELPGHFDRVGSLAFGFAGRRLATAGEGYDPTTRIWDVATGQELLVLSSATGGEPRLMFADTGDWLAVCRDSVIPWDLRPLSLSAHAERTAHAAARFHLNRPIERDAALAALRADPALTNELREQALRMAERWPDSPERFARAAWDAARSPYESPAEYQSAVDRARRFRNAFPDRLDARVILGAALWRAKRWADARNLLADSETDRPDDLWSLRRRAFLAMTYKHLGSTAEAESILALLEAEPGAAGIPDELGEAKALIRMRSTD